MSLPPLLLPPLCLLRSINTTSIDRVEKRRAAKSTANTRKIVQVLLMVMMIVLTIVEVVW